MPPVKVTGVVDAPLQTVWLLMAATVGVGFTVIVKVCAAPAQPEGEVGVTVIKALVAEVPVLAAENDAMLPVPVDASPIVGLLFIQV
jgi:hypothetical protein